MPHRVWKHECPDCEGKSKTLGVERCPDCGTLGEFDGWGCTGIEMMGRYQRVTGLPPIGPHRKHLPPLTLRCYDCQGRGMVDVNHGERYRYCPSCMGTGLFLIRTPEEMEEIRCQAQEIIRRAREENDGGG